RPHGRARLHGPPHPRRPRRTQRGALGTHRPAPGDPRGLARGRPRRPRPPAHPPECRPGGRRGVARPPLFAHPRKDHCVSTSPAVAYTMRPEHRRVFAGLMLGMLLASVSQTIVGPALPRIVAELGGMSHYSWVATAAMLVSAVTVPIIGKFSDLYGRRTFYIGGIVVFMAGTVVAGFAQSFWMLVAARAVQGLGMGTLMPLSQTIIGDIIPPRQRGKYQGLMGAVFGVTSVAGPLAGGFITDHLGWRWLFFVTLPIGLLALVFIVRFLHIPHVPRRARIDYPGIATLTLGLTS